MDDDVPDAEIEAAWAAKIERRVMEIETGAVQLVSWEHVHHRLLDE